jgi:hypothetical protein
VYRVQDWAEAHRLHEREGLSKSAIAKRTVAGPDSGSPPTRALIRA